MSIKIWPYKQGSRSARALADAVGGRVLKTDGTSRYRYRSRDLIVNWGSTQDIGIIPHGFMGVQVAEYLNDPEDVRKAADKLEAFRLMQEAGVSVPSFWTRREDIPNNAYPIVCRTILNGHSGAGIVIADTPEQLVNAPLYVQYVKKQNEYRIHVFNGNVIAVQRKARSREVADENVNWRVRNQHNGFVFVRDGVNPPDDALVQARAAIVSLGLDFGAIDIVFNQHLNRAFTLEVNTAPGLEGTTVEDYALAIRRHLT